MAKVWQASVRDLNAAGLELGQIEAVEEVRTRIDPDKIMERCKKLGLDLIIFPDPKYPKLLKEIPDPPGLLYIRGKLKPEDEVALAVVGSRKYTSYGERVVSELV